MRLQGRGAFVTGASQGIGLAIAHRLGSEGASVVLADINETAGLAAAQTVAAAGPSASFLALDVSDEADVSTAMSDAEDLVGGPIDIVVCNAGRQTFSRLVEVTREEWDQVMAVNSWGAYLTMRVAGQHLRSAGRPGSVVAIVSRTARVGAVNSPHYGASKAAALNLVKSFAVEFAPNGIRYNAVAPGMIETALWDQADAFEATLRGVEPGVPRASRVAQIPLGRAGRPDEIAATVIFLASDDASYLTGECIHVSGGDILL